MTIGGHVYNQIVTIGVQLFLVPVLLYAWGVDRYGAWLLLASIPTYLTFSDCGFTYIAKNEMTMRIAAGNLRGAVVTYQSIFMLLNIVALGVALLAAAAIWLAPLRMVFALGGVAEADAKGVLLCLSASVIFYQYFLLFSGAVRAAGRPAAEVAWNATGRLCEGAITAAIALLGGGLIAVAMAILVNRIVFTGAILAWVRTAAPEIALGFAHGSVREVRRLFHPSISYMFVSIAYALMIQGPVTVLGLIAEPDRVVLFSASRTLARLGTSAMNAINNSATPEYSRLFGLADTRKFSQILKAHLSLASAATLLYVLFTIAAGGFVLKLWTNGKLSIEEPFFALIVFSTAAEMIWSALFVPLSAINRHVKVSYAFASLSLIGLAGCYTGAALQGLAGVALALVCVQLLMVAVTSEQLMQKRPRRAAPPYPRALSSR